MSIQRRIQALGILLAALLGAAAAAMDIAVVKLDKSGETARLELALELDLNQSLRDALAGGAPISFVAQMQIVEDRWVVDRVLHEYSWTSTVRRRSYGQGYEYLPFGSEVWREAGSVEQALAGLAELELLFDDPEVLATLDRSDIFFNHRVEVVLDTLPKPLQIEMLTSNDWLFSSGWRRSRP